MGALERKLMRDIRGSGGLLLAIAAIIAIGVGCFVALRSAYHNLDDARRRYYVTCRMADFSVELKKAPVIDVAALGNLPGVVEIRPRLQFRATVGLDGAAEPLSGLVLSLPDRRDAPILNDIVLKSGSYFTPSRDEEVIVNDAFARRHRLRVGDHIRLLLNDRDLNLAIVGTAVSSEFVYLLGPGSMVPDPEHFGVFYLKQRYLEEVFDFKGACNQVVGLLAPELRDRPDALLTRAERMLGAFGVLATTPRRDQVSNRFVTNSLAGLSVAGVVMPAIFLGVAALVLGILMGRLVENQRTTLGTLKAMGYSDLRLLAHVLEFGLAVGVAGGAAGCGMGYGLAGVMTQLYTRFFEFPALVNRLDPAVFAVGMLASVACALLGAARGARAVLRLEPAEAMRPKPPRQGGVIALERVAWLWRRLDSGWRLVFRNVVRTRRRSLAAGLAAALGTTLLVMAFLRDRAAFEMIDSQFRKLQRSDIDLTFHNLRGREALREAGRLPGVDRVEPVLNVACTLRNGTHTRKGGVTGLAQGATLTVPRDRSGRIVPLPASGLLLERQLATILQVTPGDSLVIEPVEGQRTPRRARVAALFDSTLGLVAYAEIRYLSRLVDEEFAVNGVQLTVDPRRLSRSAFYAALGRLPSLEAVHDREGQYASLLSSIVDAIRGFTVFLIIAAGLILFGSTLNSALVGLAERRREVATLIVLGYTPKAVGRLFLREGLLVHLAGTLVGLGGGYGLYRGVIARLQDTELFRLPAVDPVPAWTAAFLLSLTFGLASHLVVQRAIERIDWLDALNVRE
jgi:putative ABC transport system permease protein